MPRSRDIALLLFALVGIVISWHLMWTRPSRTQAREAREDAARQHALEEQRLRAARAQALEAQQRLEAQRARVVRETEEREGQEAEVRRRQEQHKHHRRTQLDALQQAGIRSVEISAAGADTFRAVGVWLKVDSAPDGADVYLDWTRKGRTPLWLNGVSIAGFLVIVKDGQQPWFRAVDYRESGELRMTLSPEASYPSRRLLLVPASETLPDAFVHLRTELAGAGFSMPGIEDIRAFEQAEREAGGLSHHGLRAWARGTFDTRLLIKVRVHEGRRDPGGGGVARKSEERADAARVPHRCRALHAHVRDHFTRGVAQS